MTLESGFELWLLDHHSLQKLSNSCYSVFCISRLLRTPPAFLQTCAPLFLVRHVHSAQSEVRGPLCYFDLFSRWNDGAPTRSVFFRGGFHVGVSGCPPSLPTPDPPPGPGTWGQRVGLLGPQDQPSPISKTPWENLKSGPDVTAGPATLEVKVRGNHVKFATHHHFSSR